MGNPFEDAADVPLNAPGGVQDAGEFAPYYIYQEGSVVEIPAINIVRDYDYAYKVEESKWNELQSEGWCNCFESSALLRERPLKSRAIVVVSNNGWMRGDPTVYTWCVRIDIKSQWRHGMVAKNDPGVEDDYAEMMLHSGRHILWPVAPERADDARKVWSNDATLRHSRLVELYVPSTQPFCTSIIPDCQKMPVVESCTLRMLQALRPCKHPFKTCNMLPSQPPTWYEPGRPMDPMLGLWTSTVTSASMSRRAKGCFEHTTMTADNENAGWNALHDDLKMYIWEMLAKECIDCAFAKPKSPQPSLCTWLALRAICRQSKTVVEQMTINFMQAASNAMRASNASHTIEDAMRVNELLVPRGVSPFRLQGELTYRRCLSETGVFSADATVRSYMRIRADIAPEFNPSPPPHRHHQARVPLRKHATATAHLHEDAPKRSSLRIRFKLSELSMGDASPNDGECMDFQRISIKLDLVPEAAETAGKQSKALESLPAPPEDSKESVIWAQCAACDKWRRLDGDRGYRSILDVPKFFFCDMHPSKCVTCDDDEDQMEVFEYVQESHEGHGTGRNTKRRMRRLRSGSMMY